MFYNFTTFDILHRVYEIYLQKISNFVWYMRCMATRKNVINTCLSILLNTVYVLSMFYYYIQSIISLT